MRIHFFTPPYLFDSPLYFLYNLWDTKENLIFWLMGCSFPFCWSEFGRVGNEIFKW